MAGPGGIGRSSTSKPRSGSYFRCHFGECLIQKLQVVLGVLAASLVEVHDRRVNPEPMFAGGAAPSFSD